MPRDAQIASRIRAMGVEVVEISGWQTRGSDSFSPRGAVWHHTAGPSSGATPSLNTVIYGRPDLAGPLCNVLQSREPSGRDKAYVVAAGRANHAGSGGWKGLSGNSSVYGLEVEHTGTSPLPAARQDVAQRIVAAMVQGKASADMCCQHFEWTTRKIDIATGTDPNGYRAAAARFLSGGGGGPAPTPTPPPDTGDFDLSDAQYRELKQMIGSVGSAVNVCLTQITDLQKKQAPAAYVQSETGGHWIVTDQGRWGLQPYGSMNVKAIAQWLAALGLIDSSTPIKASNDYLHGIPVLTNPGKVPS